MKETIYTIPLTDAFKSGYDCPFCYIKEKLEKDGLSYFLGDALMQSDGRELTNEHGFCKEHWEKLFESRQNALGLGLIMDTYLQNLKAAYKELSKGAVEDYDELKKVNAAKNAIASIAKKTVGAKGDGSPKNGVYGDKAAKFYNSLESKHNDCTLCVRIDGEMKRYTEVFFYLWQNDEEFKELFQKTQGFCMDHFLMLIRGANKYLPPKSEGEFVPELIKKQYECLKELQKDVNWFTKKFDYRNSDEPWGNSKDALQRTIRRLHSSSIGREE